MHAARAQRQAAEQGAEQAAKEQGGGQRHEQHVGAGNDSEQRLVARLKLVENADDVAANTKIGGMAEAHEPAVSEHPIEARGSDPVDQHPCRQRHEGGLAERLGEEGQGDGRSRHAATDQDRAGPHVHADLGTKRPFGRTRSTIAMSRYTPMDESPAPSASASEPVMAWRSKPGRKARSSVSTRPTTMAP